MTKAEWDLVREKISFGEIICIGLSTTIMMIGLIAIRRCERT